jgi:hypothetical protein
MDHASREQLPKKFNGLHDVQTPNVKVPKALLLMDVYKK